MSGFEKFKEELTNKEKFYCSLTGKKISDKTWKVWPCSYCFSFGIDLKWKHWKDCHYFYLKCSVLLLADVFDKYKNISLKNYRLCPIHYLSASALNWDAIINMTKTKLKIISEADMYLPFEKGMRGRVSTCLKDIVNPTKII